MNDRDHLWRGATVLAIGILAVLLGVSFAVETPIGAVEGRVFFTSGKSASGGVYIVLMNRDTEWRVRTRTGRNGHFRVGHVPAGQYSLSAQTDVQFGGIRSLTVCEGRTTSVAVKLSRLLPSFSLHCGNRTLTPSEPTVFQVSGYTDDETPLPRTIVLEVARLSADTVFRSGAASDAFVSLLVTETDERATIPAFFRQGVPVLTKRWQIPTPQREGYFNTSFKVGPLPLGLYVIRASHSHLERFATLLVTDLGVILKLDGNQTLVYATDIVSGVPRPGVRLRLSGFDSEVSTDANGLATLPPCGKGEHVLRAARGHSYSIVNMSAPARGNADVLCVYTDRPIYRPGQTVYFKGILRSKHGTSYRVPPPTQVSVRADDAQGMVLTRLKCTTNSMGSFNGSFRLGTAAATGNGAIFVQSGSIRSVTDLPVAAYEKPNIEVTVKPAKPRYIRGDMVEFDVYARYYYGAPAASAQVRYSITAQSRPHWPTEDDDRLGSGRWSVWSNTLDEGAVTTGPDGHARIRFRLLLLSDEYVSQVTEISAAVGVIDVSGAGGEGHGSTLAFSGSYHIALDADSCVLDAKRPIHLVATVKELEGGGKPAVPVRFLATRGTGVGGGERKNIATEATHVTDAHGVARAALTLQRPGQYGIVAECSDPAGRKIRDSFECWVCSGEGGGAAIDTADLRIVADKQRYAVGDTARLLLTTRCIGATALVTVEASNVQQHWCIRLAKPSTLIKVPVRPSLQRGITVDVSCIYHKEFRNSSARLLVSDPHCSLVTEVRPDSPVHRPGDKVRLRISTRDKQGQPVPAEASVALVDEALYAIREDDPRLLDDAFYPDLWNYVETVSSCDERLLDGAGAGAKGAAGMQVRKRFLDTACWLPSVQTDSRGFAEITATLPDNITRWRATVRSHSAQTQIGYGRSEVVATLPFHVELDAPRFLTVGDTSTISALVRNGTDSAITAEVTLSLSGLAVGSKQSARQTCSIRPSSTAAVVWTVAAESARTAFVRVTARAASRGLRDAVAISLPVRPCVRERTWNAAGAVTVGGGAEHVIELAPEAAAVLPQVTVRLTPTVLAAIGPGLEYLIQYPYGCTEQTVSSFLPDLLVARLLRTVDRHTASEMRRAIPREQLQALPEMVKAGVSRLRSLQSEGWAWWGADEPDPWLTAYATMALGYAARDGYEIPRAMAASAVDSCRAQAQRASPDTAAFLSYALALVDAKPIPRRDVSTMSAPGLACVILEDRCRGHRTAAGHAAYERLRRLAVSSGSFVHWQAGRDVLYSSLTSTALALQAILACDPHSPQIEPCLRYLMAARTDDRWASTRDTAFALMALVEYVRAHPRALAMARSVSVTVNGKLLHRFSASTSEERAEEQVFRVNTALLRPGRNVIRLQCDGPGSPFYAIAIKTHLANGLDKPATADPAIVVERTYSILRPGDSGPDDSPPRNVIRGPVAPGTAIRVRLTVRTRKELNYVIVTDPYPAGYEPLVRNDNSSGDGWFDALDLRDDHAAMFAHWLPPGRYVVEYVVRAGRRGNYRALPARVEGMYEPSLWTETPVTTVDVQ